MMKSFEIVVEHLKWRKYTYLSSCFLQAEKRFPFFIATEGSPPYCFFEGAQFEGHNL